MPFWRILTLYKYTYNTGVWRTSNFCLFLVPKEYIGKFLKLLSSKWFREKIVLILCTLTHNLFWCRLTACLVVFSTFSEKCFYSWFIVLKHAMYAQASLQPIVAPFKMKQKNLHFRVILNLYPDRTGPPRTSIKIACVQFKGARSQNFFSKLCHSGWNIKFQ